MGGREGEGEGEGSLYVNIARNFCDIFSVSMCVLINFR